MINQILQDRYQIKSLLARKSGRRTFLAEDLATQQEVVVKIILFNPDFIWDDLKLFEREVEVLKSLDLPAIPKYLDSFDVDTELGKGFALVQTYIEARSLQEWIESGRTFSESDIKTIAKKLLNILDYLHHRHPPVVHRDLKPSNILLADRSGYSPGEVYLIDFGSVQTTPANGTITVVGTYGYMPPEQFGGQTSPASDLYALGATVIYLATGCHPHELPQRELRILFAERVNLSRQMVDWLKLLTEPSLDLRPQSARTCLDEIDTANLSNSITFSSTQPIRSKLKVQYTPDNFEAIVPARGFDSNLIGQIIYALIWNSFVAYWYSSFLLAAFKNPINLLLIALITVISMEFIYSGFLLIRDIFFTLFGKERLIINNKKLAYYRLVFGQQFGVFNTVARDSITKIEVIETSHTKNSGNNPVRVPSRINIWAGNRKIELCSDDDILILSEFELDWLANELGNYLNMPVTKIKSVAAGLEYD